MSLQCQKIEIKKLPFYASDITNFTSAVCAVVTEMSTVGEPIFETWANTYSGDLYNTFTTVNTYSSIWQQTDDYNVNTFVYSNSANILQVNNVVNSSSGNWNSVYNSYNSASAGFLTNSSADVRYVKLSGDIMTGGLSSPSLSTNSLYVAGSTINFFNESGNVIETLKSNDVENFKSNYTLTNSRSANWEEVYSNFSSQSANNSSVYNTVQTNSGSWNYQGTDIKSLTSNWENTYTNFSVQSSNNLSVYNSFNANSGNYNSTYNTVQTYSAAWIVDSTVDVGVRALTSNWENTYNTVRDNSATNWNYQGTDIKSLTSNWENTYNQFSTQSGNNLSVYNTVNSNSATTWNYQGTDIKSLTSNWENTYNNFSVQSSNNLSVYNSFNSNSSNYNSVYNTFNSNSSNYNSVYNTVQNNSATTWNYQGTDIKSLTSNWQNTYTNFSVQSSNNLSVYNNVNSNSGNWNYAYHTILTGGTIGGNISVSGNLSAWTADVNYVDFNSTVNNPPYQEGRLFYDNTDHTLALYVDNPNVTLNLGQEMWVLGVNKTGSIIPNGTVVYLSGAQGNRPKMWLALANNDLGSADTIGVTTHDVAINQEGYITTEGIVSNINTSNFNEGEVLYLSPTIPGGITNTKPVAPQHLVKIGYSLNSTNNGKIFVTIDNGYEIDELHNVRITNPQNDQILTYNSTSSIWINTSAYNGTDIKSLTSNWQNTYTNFSIQSGNNLSVYNTVYSNSASWIGGGGGDASVNSFVYSNSANILAVDSLVNINSGNWDSTYNTVNSNSSTWYSSPSSIVNGSYTFSLNSDGTISPPNNLLDGGSNLLGIRSSNSATVTWQGPGGAGIDVISRITASSGSIKHTLMQGILGGFVTSKEFSFNSDGTLTFPDSTIQSTAFTGTASDNSVRALTSNWQNTYSTVQTNSAQWATDSTVDTGVRALTSNWQNTYTEFAAQSSNNTSVYSTVKSNSATWTGGATYIPAAFTRWAFTGSPPTSSFSIPGATSSESAAYKVTIDYLLQDPLSYTINNSTDIITFSEAPPLSSAIVIIEETFSQVTAGDGAKWNSTYTTVNTNSATWSAPAASSITGTTLASNVVGSSLTRVGVLTGLTTTGLISSNYVGNTDSSIIIAGSNTKGGTGYHDFLRVTNGASGVTNPNKYFRINNVGGLEVINSAYNQNLFSIGNDGIVSLPDAATVSNNDAVTNYFRLNNNGSQIYDDGNMHIHSRSSGASMWINTNNGQLNLGVQSPVNGGSKATGVGIGTSSLIGYVTINGTKSWVTAAQYGYLINNSTPTGHYTGGSQTISNVSLYADGRVMANEIDALSDERVKDIQGKIPTDKAIKFIKDVDGILYTWKPETAETTDEGIKSGFSAQAVCKAGFDHMITMMPNDKLSTETDADGWTSPDKTQMSLGYNQAIPYHHEVIKNLLERIEKLEATIFELNKNICH